MHQVSLEPYESKNQAIGWITSLAFHGALVFLFFFALAWKRQIPPPPEYGVEVNFGTSDQGFGETQNFTPPGPDPAPQQAVATPAPPVEESPAEEKSEAKAEDLLTGTDETIPVETKAEAPKKATPTPPAPVKTTASPKPSSESLFPSDKPGSASNNNGNKAGTVGDMGVKGGNPDARSIYSGTPGSGGGGSSLDMAGWRWDSKPNVNDESSEEGKIVFQIKVDEEGNIISVNVLEKTVSPSLVKKYQKEVESLTFSRTAGGNNGAGATGRITFVITSR
jgi:protein TonB